MTNQSLFARKISVSDELILSAAHCDTTWRELHVVIQEHLRIAIDTDPLEKEEGQWRPA
ncbi:MAG: hypothetical protein JWO13_1324 [Acidobacteriales bacterium]|nr:hypothetical protein [Terriglobales bacterium]